MTETNTTYEKRLTFVLSHNIKGLTAEETETIILLNTAEDRATIETTDNVELSRLKKLLKANPADWKVESYTVSSASPEVLTSVVVSFPKNLITLRTATKQLHITEERRVQMAENMRKIATAKIAK